MANVNDIREKYNEDAFVAKGMHRKAVGNVVTFKNAAQKAVDEFMRAGVKASNLIGSMNKAIVMSGSNKGMVDWYDVCDAAKTSGSFKL